MWHPSRQTVSVNGIFVQCQEASAANQVAFVLGVDSTLLSIGNSQTTQGTFVWILTQVIWVLERCSKFPLPIPNGNDLTLHKHAAPLTMLTILLSWVRRESSDHRHGAESALTSWSNRYCYGQIGVIILRKVRWKHFALGTRRWVSVHLNWSSGIVSLDVQTISPAIKSNSQS